MMEETKMVEQTNFDMVCDAFYEALKDSGYEVDKEDAEKHLTPALEVFRDALREQMGNDIFVAKYPKKIKE